MPTEPVLGRLVRGGVGGLASGAVFAGVTMWFASTMPDGKAEMPLRMMSTIVKGSDAMAAGTTSIGLGVATHLVLSVAFGLVFALVVPMLATNGTVALAGTLYGGLLYVVNFLVLASLVFPVFQNANQPFELFAHIVFGTILSFFFYGSGVRKDEAFASLRAPRRQAQTR
ncbi:hypothetical protein [Amycolatopsis aidingensis]|uniref:hypothetical protein n=1 Tax=Amycolatopsis aidingensis TaxID=2842453 RepID=UPI001C0DB0C8|nr:hypothetical protein [Amycolatopsis aidingensis]